MLRLEVQRLNLARREAEARAAASQALAQQAQADLQHALAAGDGPRAAAARAQLDAEKAELAAQLEVGALRSGPCLAVVAVIVLQHQ